MFHDSLFLHLTKIIEHLLYVKYHMKYWGYIKMNKVPESAFREFVVQWRT